MHSRHWRHRRPLFTSPVPKEIENPKMKWRILPILWMAVKRMCMGLGATVLILAVYGVLITTQFKQQAAPKLPDEMVMFINFKGELREMPKDVSFADPFAKGLPTVRELVAAIDHARDDARVQGIFARIDGAKISIAHVQELRGAIKRFRGSGKFAHVYSSSYGEGGGGFGGYYLASSFDQIWMQPMGVVSIGGLNAEAPYLRGVLDKLGVHPQFFKRKEFKTAYESLTDSEMSAENKLMIRELIAGIRKEFVKDIPVERGMSLGEFEDLVDQGLFTAQEASASKLITQSNYADVLVADIKEAVTGDREADTADLFVDVSGYLHDMRREKKQGLIEGKIGPQKPQVALIYAVGAIMPSDVARGGVSASAFMGGGIAAADEIAPAIIEAAEDDEIQAIVVRVDSPGGSPTASESILRAIERAQGKGKKVIVSMGPTAASGGYWISAYADQIFVLPTTITGSIGVIGGKFSLGALWKKIGVNWDGVKWGENSGMWSLNTPFSEAEAERFNAMLDQIYDGFITRVAKGRGMTLEQVDQIAKGRVWIGSRAVEIGLADQLGGLNEALNYTAQLLGGESKNDIDITIMPKPKTALEQFIELMANQGMVYEGMKWQGAALEFFAPVLEQLSVMQNPELYTVYQPIEIQ